MAFRNDIVASGVCGYVKSGFFQALFEEVGYNYDKQIQQNPDYVNTWPYE